MIFGVCWIALCMTELARGESSLVTQLIVISSRPLVENTQLFEELNRAQKVVSSFTSFISHWDQSRIPIFAATFTSHSAYSFNRRLGSVSWQVQRLFNFLHLLRDSPFIFMYAFLFNLIAKYFELGQIYAKISNILAICCRTGKGDAWSSW